MLKPEVKAALLAARKRAQASVARLPAAVAKEAEDSELAGYEPIAVQALTEVHADHITAAMAEIKDAADPVLAEVLGVFSVSMKRSAGRKVSIRSDELLLVLDAAGVKDAA